MDCKLGLQLSDAPFRRRELGLLARREARFDARIDPCLAAPGVDRLLADLKLDSDLSHSPPTFN